MILLTGSSGFIGKHLLKALIEKYGKEQVVALTSAPIDDCPYLLHNGYSFDENYFEENGFGSIDTIIHAGAFTPKNGKQVNEWLQCNSNISNTETLLKARLPNLEKVIYLSTLDVYGSDEILSESSPLSPASLYGDSKLYCEKMITAWAKANGKISQVLRVGHVYGPGEESYQKIIPNTMMNILNNKPVQIWGSGNEIRSFVNIADIVTCILKTLELKEDIGAVNLVGSQQVTISELVQQIVANSGADIEIERVNQDQVGKNFIFDNSKMKKYLLATEMPFQEGLAAEWQYMKNK